MDYRIWNMSAEAPVDYFFCLIREIKIFIWLKMEKALT